MKSKSLSHIRNFSIKDIGEVSDEENPIEKEQNCMNKKFYISLEPFGRKSKSPDTFRDSPPKKPDDSDNKTRSKTLDEANKQMRNNLFGVMTVHPDDEKSNDKSNSEKNLEKSLDQQSSRSNIILSKQDNSNLEWPKDNGQGKDESVSMIHFEEFVWNAPPKQQSFHSTKASEDVPKTEDHSIPKDMNQLENELHQTKEDLFNVKNYSKLTSIDQP